VLNEVISYQPEEAIITPEIRLFNDNNDEEEKTNNNVYFKKYYCV
jgi:hypothetical protein